METITNRELIQEERSISGQRFLISDNVELISIDFVRESFASSDMWWAKPFDAETTKFLLRGSETFGVYEMQARRDGSESLRQVGMARWATDYVTFAWLTDVYIAPGSRGKGLGRWLVGCCKRFIDGLPGLRQAMTMTSNHEQGVPLYTKILGMQICEQEPGKGSVVLRTKK